MFNLFGKKKEKEEKPLTGEELQVQAFAQQFQAEEWDIVAVTGGSGLRKSREEGETLWTVRLPLTAWMDEEDGIVKAEPAQMVILADERLYDYLRHCIPRDFIIKCRVRPAKEGSLFQMVSMPEPGFDPELKAILNEQVKPVTFEDEVLGEFTFNREMGWFAANVDWLGGQPLLTVDSGEDREQALACARSLVDQQQSWDGRVRAFAADALLEQANEGLEEDAQTITREDFLERMELSSVQVYADGTFEFWFEDDERFWGRSVHVSGTVNDGPKPARMEG